LMFVLRLLSVIPTVVKTKLPQDGTPETPSVIYVAGAANNGHVVLPRVFGNTGRQANTNDDAKRTFIPQIFLSCFVFWLFGFVFGLIAFILASKRSS